MTTRLALACALGAALFACIGGGSGRRGGLPEATIQSFPPDVAEAYQLFAVRCSRCHTLARPLDASITDYHHWEEYVARMRHHAGSGISPRDAERILVFLKYYTDLKVKQLEGDAPETPPPPAPPPDEKSRLPDAAAPVEVAR